MPIKADELNSSPKRVPFPDWGLVVFEARHAPGFFGELKDTYAKFHLVIAGRALWESGEHQFTVAADSLFHIAAQVPHRQRDLPGQPVTLYAIHYRTDLLRAELTQALDAAPMLPIDLQAAGPEQARQVRGIVQEMMFEQEAQRPGWQALLISRLTDLAVLSLRWLRRSEFRIQRIDESAARVASYAARLKSEFYSASSLDEAARSVGLGRRRFTELFREVTGESWRRYVHRLRMEYAAKLLESTDRSVTAVAFECGFEELSHFHHSFKAAYHVTPLAYRLKFRPKSHS
ncbi:MAG: helix-turn-helix transcriptional regulator [Opitutaceae bacterium]|nr:helix-turn-helix transcriptional regulator [Opitutaceae bacterium]